MEDDFLIHYVLLKLSRFNLINTFTSYRTGNILVISGCALKKELHKKKEKKLILYIIY